jgi:hypothetical protein
VLDSQLLIQTPLRFPQPRRAITFDRLGVGIALDLELALGFPQPCLTTVARPQLLGQLIAATVTELLVLRGVNRSSLLENRTRELLVVDRCIPRRICGRRVKTRPVAPLENQATGAAGRRFPA